MDKIVERMIDGVLYKARFRGMAYAFEMQNLARQNQSEYRLTEILFSEILISPEVGIDDFEDLDALDTVRSFLLDVALGNFEPHLSKARIRAMVNDEWACWRLIYCDMASFDWNTVFHQMTPLEIEKANMALDKVQKEIKAQSKRK